MPRPCAYACKDTTKFKCFKFCRVFEREEYTYDLRTPCKFKIQIWKSPFLVQRILRRYCRENAKKIQEYIQNQLQNYRQLIGIIIVGNACISVDMLQEIAEVVLIQPAELKAA